jgi:type IV secretory pathway TraG/TraD family ATPase VirD4
MLEAFHPITGWLKDRPQPFFVSVVFDWMAKTFVDGVLNGPWFFGLPDFNVVVPRSFAAIRFGLSSADLVQPLTIHLIACAAVGLFTAVVAAITTLRATAALDGLTHISGKRLMLQKAALRFAKIAERAPIKAKGEGLLIAPGLRISFDRESRHVMVVGGTGAGKTVIIRFWLGQIFARRDKAIILDSKGNVTAELAEKFTLLAPHDQRSAAWAVARDVVHGQDARELASALIPSSKDPVWANGAREILIGVVISLQIRRGTGWSWGDLATGLYLPATELRALLVEYYFPAVEFVEVGAEGLPTRTTTSLLITMRTSLAATVLPLAEAWSDLKSRPQLSVRAWLLDPGPRHRIIVLQRAAHLPELSRAFISAFVRSLASTAASPELSDDDRRRIWVIMDEMAQAGHIEGFGQLIEVGRSKGLCCVLGWQDPAQIEEHYGEPATRTWISSIGTKIVGRLEAGRSSATICNDWIGDRIVTWTERTESSGPSSNGPMNAKTTSTHVRREQMPVILPDCLERSLGRRDHFLHSRIAALVLGIGGDALQVEWPVIPQAKLRPGIVVANWLRSGSAKPAVVKSLPKN